MTEREAFEALQAENARLVTLLESHGIAWHAPPAAASRAAPIASVPVPAPAPPGPSLSTAEKVALFRRLFRGRTDVYPVRWEGKTSGKSGYAPACANEWRAGVCEKPRIKCGDCGHRLLVPLSDSVIYDHLAGKQTVGVYPLLEDDTCHFLAVDFDEADWQQDTQAFMQSCDELGVPAALEISRSGRGAHAWVFFAGRVSARDARRLRTAIISHTCARTRQLRLASYDRLFPNQDTMPKGGFGNLIALPLQKHPRESGCSVFVDATLRPYGDQWAYLAAIQPMAPHDIEPTILRATGGVHPLDVTFIDDEDLATPWKRQSSTCTKLAGTVPQALTVTLANLVYFEKSVLPQALANRLIRLAAFQNPEFYKAQAMRMSVWDKPRVIGNAENYPQHIALPRGCLDAARALLKDNGIRCDPQDEIRRDGQQPIIFMQCGPIRHTAARPVGAPHDLEVLPRSRFARIDLPTTAGIQDVFRHLANDMARTDAIAAEAAAAFEQGRKVLVLTERTEHLEAIRQALIAQAPAPFVLHGRMSKKQRAALISEMETLPSEASRILLATGKLIGEGFDHPPLDTLVLAMPVSWKGTLQQYAGRLHREHASKADVRIIDFVDTGHSALLRMWEKRQRGYRAMGYRVGPDASSGHASIEDVEVPGFVPSEQLFVGQAASAGVATGVGP